MDKNTAEARGALYEFITLSGAVLISNKQILLLLLLLFFTISFLFPLLQHSVGAEGPPRLSPWEGAGSEGGAARDEASPRLPPPSTSRPHR